MDTATMIVTLCAVFADVRKCVVDTSRCVSETSAYWSAHPGDGTKGGTPVTDCIGSYKEPTTYDKKKLKSKHVDSGKK